MIERPASATSGVTGGESTGGVGDSGAVETVLPPFSTPTFAEQAPSHADAPHPIAGTGPDPSLAAGTPRPADRVSAQVGPVASRTSTRSAQRASHRVENMTYRAIFACCLQATETPTE